MHQRLIPVVRIILEDLEGRILLLKRANTIDGEGQLCLPGGKVDYNKTVEQACIDEVKEETNLDAYNLRFLFYQDMLPISKGETHWICFYFAAEHAGKLNLNRESSDAIWIKPSCLSSYDIAFRNDKAIIRYLSEFKKL